VARGVAKVVAGIVADRDRLRAQLAQVTAERDEAQARLDRVMSTDSSRLTPGMVAEHMRLDLMWQKLIAERDSARALADIRGREVERLEREQLTPEEVEALRFALVEYPPKSGSYVVRTKAALAILDKLITGAKP